MGFTRSKNVIMQYSVISTRSVLILFKSDLAATVWIIILKERKFGLIITSVNLLVCVCNGFAEWNYRSNGGKKNTTLPKHLDYVSAKECVTISIKCIKMI